MRYIAGAFDASTADALHVALRAEIAWEQHCLRLFGRRVEAPRLSAWIADPGASYRYSGTRFEPRAWTHTAGSLRDRLNARLGAGFNSVLANLYRDGRDSMGWHADDEPELGAQPLIASLSFGAARKFRLRSRRDKRVVQMIELEHGSLLLMGGETQRLYQHDLPKVHGHVEERINLTFRHIQSSTERRCARSCGAHAKTNSGIRAVRS